MVLAVVRRALKKKANSIVWAVTRSGVCLTVCITLAEAENILRHSRQIFPELRNRWVSEGSAQVQFSASCNMRARVHMQSSPLEIRTATHGRQQDRPVTCVIAQKYSSVTFVS